MSGGTRIAPRFYFKHGGYYHVRSHRKPPWIHLGHDYNHAVILYTEMEARIESGPADELIKHLRKLVSNSRQRAKRRRLPHDLTYDQVLSKCLRTGWLCDLSSMPFSLDKQGCSRRPLAPSLDRIDIAQGYTDANVRVVCSALNYAMNEWGKDLYLALARGVLRKSSRPSKILRHQTTTHDA